MLPGYPLHPLNVSHKKTKARLIFLFYVCLARKGCGYCHIKYVFYVSMLCFINRYSINHSFLMIKCDLFLYTNSITIFHNQLFPRNIIYNQISLLNSNESHSIVAYDTLMDLLLDIHSPKVHYNAIIYSRNYE